MGTHREKEFFCFFFFHYSIHKPFVQPDLIQKLSQQQLFAANNSYASVFLRVMLEDGDGAGRAVRGSWRHAGGSAAPSLLCSCRWWPRAMVQEMRQSRRC